MVTGGLDQSWQRLDTTEWLFAEQSSEWNIGISKLPVAISSPGLATINNDILLFGKKQF